jgi:N-acetylneuraminate synthase/N,N'-diacetyllegionaminate synthase
VIAEAGVNHNGSFDEAQRLIATAKKCGADAVKFQMFDSHLLGRPELRKYQLGTDMLEDLQFYAERLGIDFLCTPFDQAACEWLTLRRVKYMKLGSGAIFNDALLNKARDMGVPVLLSTGMATIAEIEHAARILQDNLAAILHCVSAYPVPLDQANLRALITLRRQFGYPIGYSDHTVCIDALLAAVALGAKFIEAHLTHDCDQEGPDHQASYMPGVFQNAVGRIRQMEKILGSGRKVMQPCEKACRDVWAPKAAA